MSDDQILYAIVVFIGILMLATFGNLRDPNSETNDLYDVLALDEPPSDKVSTRDANIARARQEIYARLQARNKA